MAVGNIEFPEMHSVAGFALGTTEAGVRYENRKDLVVMRCAEGSIAAATFTQNAFCAAPVTLCKQHLAKTAPRYLVTNTGNANAGTGKPGMQHAEQVCEALAKLENVSKEAVLPFSTGVIGETLPVDQICKGLPSALANLSEDASAWKNAAEGILTTDTAAKGASRKIEIDGHAVTVTGIAKGSGMIRPNMATMLGYLATDVAIDQNLLDQLTKRAVEASFNRITVDGDTSTNDSFVVIATGKSSLPKLNDVQSDAAMQFYGALEEVCIELAQKMVRDGEGATKFITVEVNGGKNTEECLQVAYAVAHSPLVKTALFASDPNWGRILAAVGYAGVENLDVNQIAIWLDNVCIVENGERATNYTEEQGQAAMDQEEIHIRIALGRGNLTETVWTTDLSYDYIKINAEYRS